MNRKKYQGLLETLDILKDRRAVKEIAESLKQAESGQTYSFEQVTGRKQKNERSAQL